MADDGETMQDSWAERELEFDGIEGQGKLSPQRNLVEEGSDGAREVGMRVKITHHSNVLGTRVYGLIHKVRWGTYKGEAACLLVVRFRFTFSTGFFRLRKAVVVIRFDNHPVRKEGRPVVGCRDDPILRIFSPRQIYGIPTEVEHEVAWSAAAQCSISAGPVGVGPEISRASTARYTTQAAIEIAGMDDADLDKDLPNIVTFEIDENSKTSRGIPRELYFGAVVQCDGTIQADIEASVSDRSAWPWTRDDPIILKPGLNYGGVPAGLPHDFDHLTDDDWKVLVPYQDGRTNTAQGRTS